MGDNLEWIDPEKVRQAIEDARQWQAKNGNPIEYLIQLLDEAIEDEDLWREIVDEPYG